MPNICPVFKWHLNSRQFVPYSEQHLNNGPFNDRTIVHDLNNREVGYLILTVMPVFSYFRMLPLPWPKPPMKQPRRHMNSGKINSTFYFTIPPFQVSVYPNTGHSKTGNIRKLDVCDIRFLNGPLDLMVL